MLHNRNSGKGQSGNHNPPPRAGFTYVLEGGSVRRVRRGNQDPYGQIRQVVGRGEKTGPQGTR